MARIILVQSRMPTVMEQEAIAHLSRAYADAGHHVRVLRGSFTGIGLRLPFTAADIYDFHGARVSTHAWVTRLLKRHAQTICTLHEREEFHPAQRLWGRMRVRAGTWVALNTAHEVIATQKLLQVVLFQMYGRLPTYIPQGVPTRVHYRRPAPPFGLRRGSYIVTVTSRASPMRLTARIRARIVWLRMQPLPASRRRGTRRISMAWQAPEADALLDGASAIIILEPLRFPGHARKIALAGHPILTLDTPEHREAFGARVTYLPSAAPAAVAHGLRRLTTNHDTLAIRARRLTRVTEHLYTWDHIAKDVLKAYRRDELTPVPVDSLSLRVTSSH